MKPTLAIALLAGGAAFAQSFPDYFPLQAGNQWIYSGYGGFPSTTSVVGTQQANGTTYAMVQTLYGSDPGSGGVALLRSDGAGKVYQWDAQKQQESLLYDFTQPAGARTSDGKPYVIATAGNYTGPLGTFNVAYEIGTYTPLGGSTTTFLPYIGMVASSVFNTSGSAALLPPVTFDLIYARIADITVVSSKEWGISLTVDRPVYSLYQGLTETCGIASLPGSGIPYVPCGRARIALRVNGNDPVKLSFPTQQIYELELKDANGKSIWKLSDRKMFGTKPRDLVVMGEVDFGEQVPLYAGPPEPYGGGQWLTPGVYRLSATLLDVPGGSASASVTFTIIR